MIQSILTGIFKLVTSLVSIILAPIDLAIGAALPSVSNALTMVGSFFNWMGSAVAWVWSWVGLSSTVTALFVGYLVFKYTVPFTIHTVKLALQWYDKIKP